MNNVPLSNNTTTLNKFVNDLSSFNVDTKDYKTTQSQIDLILNILDTINSIPEYPNKMFNLSRVLQIIFYSYFLNMKTNQYELRIDLSKFYNPVEHHNTMDEFRVPKNSTGNKININEYDTTYFGLLSMLEYMEFNKIICEGNNEKSTIAWNNILKCIDGMYNEQILNKKNCITLLNFMLYTNMRSYMRNLLNTVLLGGEMHEHTLLLSKLLQSKQSFNDAIKQIITDNSKSTDSLFTTEHEYEQCNSMISIVKNIIQRIASIKCQSIFRKTLNKTKNIEITSKIVKDELYNGIIMPVVFYSVVYAPEIIGKSNTK